jgi:HK97 family phage prohead protease
MMPFPNEHAARLRNPKDFNSETFRRTQGGTIFGRIKIPKTISIIWGKLKGKDKPSDFPLPQSLRFPIKNWTMQEAKKWLSDNNIKHVLFEEAEKEKGENHNSDIESINFEENDFFSIEFINDSNDSLYNEEKGLEVFDAELKSREDLEYKTFSFDILETKTEQDGEDEIGVFQGSMATEHKDRGNDIIAPDAFDNSLERYRKAKRRIRLFYQHNTSKVPIGGIDPKNIIKDGKKWNIKGELDFGVRQAQEVYSALKKKNLSDLSIGFTINDQDFKKETRLIRDAELWEVSVVSEPMNPKATITDVKNLKSVNSFKDFPIVKDSDGKIDTKHKWDGTAAEKRVRKFTDAEDAPNAHYRSAFMWFDEAKPDLFGSYKLLYVDVVNDKLQVIPRAIFEKAALLHGGRRGLDVSEEDKKKIASHVNKYYDKMGLESPLRSKSIEYLSTFNEDIKIIHNYDIDDVEHVVTQKSFEDLLKNSGSFSRQAAIYLAKYFNPQKQSESVNSKDQKQSESVDDSENKTLTLKKINELIDYINNICGE